MAKFNVDKTEQATMDVLKDFQRMTVERIYHLFKNGQNRVLVADEVGLGKTLIARGVIAKTARLRIDEGDDLFKVVYICSNISIANQNIRKLRVSDSATIEGMNDTRLSMQHLKICQQENDQKLREGFIQLIPLTPGTSFQMTTGGGTVNERALMYAILHRMQDFSDYPDEVEALFQYAAVKSWNWYRDEYERQVRECEGKTAGAYPSDLIEKIYFDDQSSNIIGDLKSYLEKRRNGSSTWQEKISILNRLRIMFARLSARMLQPDLVIMDEFQRFKYLLSSEENSEIGILARLFLGSSDTRTLLLSATPYKLYSTMEEIDDSKGVDDHFQEFHQVMRFLLSGENQEFEEVWSNYNVALRELRDGDTSVLQVKNRAEDAMYRSVCRTERISVMESGDYTDDSSVKHAISITENDIRSYLAMRKLLKDIEANYSVPMDYVKSCPYLMSFMKDYKVKERIERYFAVNPGNTELAENSLLWVDPQKVNRYKPLQVTNARLSELQDRVFESNAELFLWVPPSRPYYELQGPYRHARNFSKVLVFSAWEMVPRMIGALLSYQAECLTVGEVCKKASQVEPGNKRYNARRRYPYQRLNFQLKGSEPQRMTVFTLIYPSKILAELYDPITCMNNELKLSWIEHEIRDKVRQKLKSLEKYQKEKRAEDRRWYYLAPMLMDGFDYVRSWIIGLRNSQDQIADEGEGDEIVRSNNAFTAHLDRLAEMIEEDDISLGGMPDDLAETMTNMALASPAVCCYRSNGGNAIYATELARVFLNYFNTTESTAVIQLSSERFHARISDETAHWQDVLIYCKDGCFQAMIDEYRHLINDSCGFSSEEIIDEQIHRSMMENLRMRSAPYEVDTFEAFQNRVGGEQKEESEKGLRIRTHYAVGFINAGKSETEKSAVRKENIRAAFNSPLKPFVLATTSIGQEGLDFHNYCRKIVHWNLPANPIDLEQREGRINRFKCLAIRQNVAGKYGSIHFDRDIWEEMFKAAERERENGQSELVPYWCFGKNQNVKIERIVPMYPMSQDEISYERLIKILSLYRITLGQARQEELLEYLFKECKNPNELKKLFLDLSPYTKGTGEEEQYEQG